MSKPIPFMQPRMVGERFQKSMDEVEHISILDDNDVSARLDEFRSLKDGWLDGKGVAPHPQGLDWFAGCFENHYPNDLFLPCLYPTAEGGVQVEWTLGGHEASLDVNLDTHQGEWHCLNRETEEDFSHLLDLNSMEGWRWLAGQIRQRAETPK